MTTPLVLLLHNHPQLPADHPDAESEYTIVAIAEMLGEILQANGFRIARLGLKQDPTLLWREIQRREPAVIFNLFEGNLEDTDTESHVAGLLEWSVIPFTGSSYRALTLARDKYLTKVLLRGMGIPTADFFVVEKLPVPTCTLKWPVIVKPAQQDASVGIDQDSVVTNQQQLERRVEYILETYGPSVLVEEFIRGREFNVALTELPDLCRLPVAEIHFHDKRPGYWPMLTYEGKWRPGTAEYDLTPPECPARISARLARKLCDLAERAYRLVGCRDYARVDFRVSDSGDPYILEVNPNPDLSDTAGFARCLRTSGTTYEDFIVQLTRFALTRTKSREPRDLAALP